MKNLKADKKIILAMIISLSLGGCASVDRINATMDQAGSDYDRAERHMNDLTSNSVVRETNQQWINTVPINDKLNPVKAVPGCSISLTMPGAVTIYDISQRITRFCHVPVTVTPDAVMAINGSASGGRTEQIKGAVPAPDASGMIPLASMGGASTQTPQTQAGNTLQGLYWNGSLSGLLDTVASRLGLSWRYTNGRISFYYLETRSYAIQFMDSKADFSSKVVSGTTSTAGNTGGSGGNSISGDSNTSQTTTMEINSKLYDSVQDAVKSMLTPGTGRMFLSSGVLTATDTPQVLDSIGSFIDNRNTELNRQVKLNVEVLSVEKKKQDQLGGSINALFKSGSVGGSVSNAFNDVTSGVLSGGLSILDGKFGGTEAFINALSSKANVSVLTQQASTTTNMTPLPMQVADQEDYAQSVSTDSTANVGTSTSITPATITTGFNMTMLPYIMPDANSIQLQFSISLSDSPTRRTFTSGTSSVELLKTKLKTVNQRVNMKSGQTIVLSGFQQANRKGSKQGVGSPNFLGLGGGFNGEDDNTMLVILITPTVL